MPLKDNWYIAAEARELKRKPIGLELYGKSSSSSATKEESPRHLKTAARTAI